MLSSSQKGFGFPKPFSFLLIHTIYYKGVETTNDFRNRHNDDSDSHSYWLH